MCIFISYHTFTYTYTDTYTHTSKYTRIDIQAYCWCVYSDLYVYMYALSALGRRMRNQFNVEGTTILRCHEILKNQLLPVLRKNHEARQSPNKFDPRQACPPHTHTYGDSYAYTFTYIHIHIHMHIHMHT